MKTKCFVISNFLSKAEVLLEHYKLKEKSKI